MNSDHLRTVELRNLVEHLAEDFGAKVPNENSFIRALKRLEDEVALAYWAGYKDGREKEKAESHEDRP